MVAARLSGDIEAATSLLLDFEAQLGVAERAEDPIEVTGQRSATEAPTQMLQGILPSYYRELATTALAGGDFVKARHYWQKLRRLAESMMDAPDRGLSRASMRTITDRISARRWLRLALYELAFTELHDGDVRSCAELITLADGVSADEATRPPGLSWVGGEIARAHLAYELDNDALRLRASEQLAPLSDRIEQWPLLLIAESESTRLHHGTARALAQLETTMAKTDETRRASRSWRTGLNGYRALLYSVLGNLVLAERLLDELDSEAPEIQVERARLALFAGDDVQALLLSQIMEDASTTKRSRLARTLITAVAAWNCDKRQEALLAMSRAAPLLHECYRPSSLWNVPYDALRAVAVAARDEGLCDVVEMVDAVPESARAARYARLTDMEQRTLQSIAEHRNANDAAQALFVTPGTVKKHLASVYRKLAVNGRDEAILRAARMGLIAVGGTSKS